MVKEVNVSAFNVVMLFSDIAVVEPASTELIVNVSTLSIVTAPKSTSVAVVARLSRLIVKESVVAAVLPVTTISEPVSKSS